VGVKMAVKKARDEGCLHDSISPRIIPKQYRKILILQG
jgi:hypothetical protein